MKALESEERTLKQFLESPLAKDKEIQVSRFENVRVNTGGRSYSLKVEEWQDHSDSAETLKVHQNLPFLALSIRQRITLSQMAQKNLDKAATKVKEMNHTDVPHRQSSSERDTLHELT